MAFIVFCAVQNRHPCIDDQEYADRIFMLVKNHVLAVSGMGDEAPPTLGGRNGGSDVL